MWSPKSASASACASSATSSSPRVRRRIEARLRSSAGKRTPVSVTIAAVGTAAVLTTATVRSGSATARFLGLAAPRRSSPSSRSAPPPDAQRGLGQVLRRRGSHLLRLLAGDHLEERGAVALRARVVLVARRLVDL